MNMPVERNTCNNNISEVFIVSPGNQCTTLFNNAQYKPYKNISPKTPYSITVAVETYVNAPEPMPWNNS